MKKVFLTLGACLALTAGSLFAQTEAGAIGRAKGVAHDCLQNYNSSMWIVMYSAYQLEDCQPGGASYEVLISVRPDPSLCSDCPPAMPIVIADVVIGCQGEILYNSCY